MDEQLESDSVILKFIFDKVSEDMKLEWDSTTILEKLCVRGWMSEEERQTVIVCVTHSAKNK